MSDSPVDLDLKFLPDWLKEGAGTDRYANYQGDTGDRGDRGDRGRGDRPRRDDRGGRGERRGPKPGGGDRRGPQRDERGRGARPQGRRDDRPQERTPRPPRVEAPPAPEVKVEFLPEPNCVAGIARQIRSGGRAYPLFGTARLFLEKPERHRVRITCLDPAVPLVQCGDGPVSFDHTSVERNAFRQFKDEYYVEEVAQGEPLKGNFTNVARSRSTGVFLGPTNHHGYQPALRKLYEERFSRRMSFPEFLREDVQVLNDEQAIADWKEQARSTTSYVTRKEAEPLTFKSLAEAEQHFRNTYLPQLMKSGKSLETSGHASRSIGERSILEALRKTWDQERAFPQNLVNLLRPHFMEAGLHFFKHRKRILYVSPIRPQRHPAGESFSAGIGAILTTVGEHPKITRPQLAARMLGEGHDKPEAQPRKEALAADLHYLIHVGHVIEFHDGTLDLPLAPNAKPEPEETVREHGNADKAVPPAQQAEAPVAAIPAAAPLDEPTAADAEYAPGEEAQQPVDQPGNQAMEPSTERPEGAPEPETGVEPEAAAEPWIEAHHVAEEPRP